MKDAVKSDRARAPQADRTFKLQLMINDEERGAIDAWQFDQRIASRAEAVRRLIRLGLERASES